MIRWLHCFFNIWPFTRTKFCPVDSKICLISFNILTNTKQFLTKWPEFFNISPNWRNFVKSGHTGWTNQRTVCHFAHIPFALILSFHRIHIYLVSISTALFGWILPSTKSCCYFYVLKLPTELEQVKLETSQT